MPGIACELRSRSGMAADLSVTGRSRQQVSLDHALPDVAAALEVVSFRPSLRPALGEEVRPLKDAGN